MSKREKRIKSRRYAEVYFEERIHKATGKKAKFFYIRYNKNGSRPFELVGNSIEGWTEAKANLERSRRIEGKSLSNKEIREQQKVKSDKWTVQKLWQEYLAQKHNLKGLKTDQNRFDNHIAPKFGSIEVGDIDQKTFLPWRAQLIAKKSPKTTWNVLELFRRIINFGVRQNLCKPLSFHMELPTVNNIKTEDLTPEQLSKLLEAIKNDHHEHAGTMLMLVLYTGMRRGELFRLQWDHIDWHRKFIRLIDPKGGPEQSIPMSTSVGTLLKNHQRPFPESPYVFPGRDGHQRTEISKPVRRIRENAGLPDSFRPVQGLRHVFASMMSSSGKVDSYTLQKLLTHKSPQMTQRYAHLRDEALHSASNIADQIIQQAEIND